MKKSKTSKSVKKAGTAITTPRIPVKKNTKPVASKPVTKKAILKPATKSAPSTPMNSVHSAQLHAASPSTGMESLRQEITALRTQFSRQAAPVATGSMEEVDALRRVLNDLMEARMNDVIRELVAIRNSASSAGGEARRIAEQMDALLSDLGAMRFEAERLEHADPLIHTISREVSDASLADGIIVETLRPGFHTSRGIVVAKALVAVNRRS
jgi:molecular chaperone GrpE (heat shock protein)